MIVIMVDGPENLANLSVVTQVINSQSFALPSILCPSNLISNHWCPIGLCVWRCIECQSFTNHILTPKTLRTVIVRMLRIFHLTYKINYLFDAPVNINVCCFVHLKLFCTKNDKCYLCSMLFYLLSIRKCVIGFCTTKTKRVQPLLDRICRNLEVANSYQPMST